MDERLLASLVKLRRWKRDKTVTTLSAAELVTLLKIQREVTAILDGFETNNQEC